METFITIFDYFISPMIFLSAIPIIVYGAINDKIGLDEYKTDEYKTPAAE